MTISVYDLVLKQRGKDFHLAFQALSDAAAFAEQQSRSKNKGIAAEARERRADLGRVLFWFHHASRADGTKPEHWQALKIIAQDLVDRGNLKAEVMNRF